MAITRIKTNQITDANVTTEKIADNAVTAGKLADNLSYGSDFTVTGNLTVSGTTVSVSTTNTRVEDKILALAAEATGSATHDAGVLINRGDDDNQALLWDESADQFVLANVGSDNGDTAGNVTISSYAPLQVGAFLTSALASLDGGINVNDDFTVDVNGNAVAVGLVTTGVMDFNNTTTSSSSTTGAVQIAGGAGVAENLFVGGTLGVTGETTLASAVVSDLTATRVTLAGTSGALEDSASLVFDGTTFKVGAGTKFNITASSGNTTLDGTLGVTTGLASLDGGINVNDDFTVDASGNTVIVGLATSGVVNLNNVTESTSSTTGALIVDGGVGIAKDLWVGIDLDVVGATTLDGAVTLGNASGDAIAITGTATFTPSADFDGGFTVAASQTVGMGANRVTGVADPSSAQDASTKAYVDAATSAASTLAIAGDSGTDNVTVGSDTWTFAGTASEITTAVTNNTVTIGMPDDVTITGNLTVSGTTTTVNSTVTTLADPIITLGSSASDDNKDRGIEFKYNSGGAKTGFFGFDDSTAGFIFIADATNTSEVFSGTAAAATFGAITATDVTATGSFIIGSASMNEADLEKLDGITNGTGAAAKALVLGSSNEISTGGVVTATGFTIGSAAIIEAELETIDGVTAGTAAASKAVVLDASRNIATIGSITLDGSLIIGAASMSEADLEKIDGITNGAGAANKAVVLDGSANIASGLANVIASGDLQGATVTMTGLTSNQIVNNTSGELNGSSDLTFDGTTLTVGGADSTVFSATTAGVVNIDGAATVDGLASLDGGIDVATAKFAVSAAGIVTTVEDIRITVDNKQLEIGAAVGGDFTIGHDGTDTTITNSTGILAINSAGGIRINESAAAVDFVIESDTNTTMFMVDASQNNIGIGGAPNANAVLHINDTGALIIATGTTAQRPGSAVTGMFRFNSTLNDIEFAKNDGSWTTVAVDYTVAATQRFTTANGSLVDFTLSALSGNDTYIAAGILVMLNGIVQDPADVYSIVSDTTLRFSTAPLSGDVIEVRKFTTASTITALADNDGDTMIQLEESSDEDTIRFDIAGTETMTLAASVLDLKAASALRFSDTDSSNYVAFKAPGTVSADVTWTLPGADGTSGQALVTNASGVLSWAAAGAETTADESTNTNFLIRFDAATSGAVTAVKHDTGFTYNPSTGTLTSAVFAGEATSALYADLAEMYATDEAIEAGTVVHFSGEGKVAACDVDACSAVAGIVSTDPAYLMNSGQEGAALALAGRVPCKVTGPVAAGDMMVSAGNGMARAESAPTMGTVIGKAIEANEGGEGVIEVLALMM